ncbi:cell growth defect protein [Thalictrum thalictroides]|uniref:Cell growth defect protein n=1 Tax=Thalictrum thalictroides TaxID=46969 RepID=A0A7J6VET4_THATH|nr:cell growth defect protein [Thalictrum thalictroides]
MGKKRVGGRIRIGYAWAISAGFNAAFAAIAAKFFSDSQLVKYGFIIFFNVMMWGCYVNSLKALSSLQATVANFATNFLSSGLAGIFLFNETMSNKLIHSIIRLGVTINIIRMRVMEIRDMDNGHKGLVDPRDVTGDT